jgi:hypothetical membrane protein
MSPGYSHLSGSVSDLAEQGRPHATVMRIGIFIGGLLLAAFAIGLASTLPVRRRAVTGCLLVAGLATVLASIFHDYGSYDGAPRNQEGLLHNTFGVIMITSMAAAMAFMVIVANESHAWQALLRPTLAFTTVVALAAGVFQSGPISIQGLAQRVLYLAALIWVAVVADHAVRLAGLARHQPHRREATISKGRESGPPPSDRPIQRG